MIKDRFESTYDMYKGGRTSNSVSTMRRKAGNWRRDAKIRSRARGVVSKAD